MPLFSPLQQQKLERLIQPQTVLARVQEKCKLVSDGTVKQHYCGRQSSSTYKIQYQHTHLAMSTLQLNATEKPLNIHKHMGVYFGSLLQQKRKCLISQLSYFAVYDELPCIMHTHVFVHINMGLSCPCHVIIILRHNVHPYLSLKNLGKKVHIIHGKIQGN